MAQETDEGASRNVCRVGGRGLSPAQGGVVQSLCGFPQRVCGVHPLDNSAGSPSRMFHRAGKTKRKRPNFTQPECTKWGTQLGL